MYRFLIALLLVDAFILAAAVLLQAGKGGGLAASFGGAGSSPNSLLGSREAGNLLTNASWWTGGIFLFLALVLSIINKRGGETRSVLDPVAKQAPAAAPGAVPATSGTQAAPLQPIVPPAGTSKTPPEKQPPSGGKQPPAGKQQ